MALSRVLDRLPLRQRLGVDPLASLVNSGQRFTPVPIDRLKVTGNLRERILRGRVMNHAFHTEPGSRLAVVVPFRDREPHLQALLPALSRVLDARGITYRVIVAEQTPGQLFNRGLMKNIGAHVAEEEADYFCFQDVDTLPETAHYDRPSQPLRLIKRYSRTFRPTPEFYGSTFAGAISMRREHFRAANGFDNGYWGFGNEDEDFFLRLLLVGLVPHEDRCGVFNEFENPQTEATDRTPAVRSGNKRRMIWQCFTGRIGASGLSDLSFRILARRDEGRVTRVTVEV
jgi:hypothetical protein